MLSILSAVPHVPATLPAPSPTTVIKSMDPVHASLEWAGLSVTSACPDTLDFLTWGANPVLAILREGYQTFVILLQGSVLAERMWPVKTAILVKVGFIMCQQAVFLVAVTLLGQSAETIPVM